jgi:hypothetical protein
VGLPQPSLRRSSAGEMDEAPLIHTDAIFFHQCFETIFCDFLLDFLLMV